MIALVFICKTRSLMRNVFTQFKRMRKRKTKVPYETAKAFFITFFADDTDVCALFIR